MNFAFHKLMQVGTFAVPHALSAQSPSPLVNYRKSRYRGDDFCLAMGEFAESDQVRIREMYHFLQGMFTVLKAHHSSSTAESLGAAQDFVVRQDTDQLLHCVRFLGVESLDTRWSQAMAKTLHDLRGGAMSALIGELQMAALRTPDDRKVRQLFFRTRDHLKIMRNALLGLDDEKREADLIPIMHSVDLIAEKWQNALLSVNDRTAHLDVACDFHGNIAECCVEFGALDRVLYNLVNNACRHTASGEVNLAIESSPEGIDHPENLRFRVSNPVDAADEQQLSRHDDLRDLFKAGVSSTGSGFGLAVAQDFVTNAYGLKTRAQALDEGYLGAQLVDRNFLIWFHWPIAADV